MMTAEKDRLKDPKWKAWGSYVPDRLVVGNVWESYSANGDA